MTARHVTIGVIGHVDHGKTALVGALSGMQTDRLPEERARGISIALGFAHVQAGGCTVDLIDMPGHERFVRTMVAGATGIDAVLLVVDAREGVRPQTREHVDIARLLGIQHAVLAVSRTDLAGADEAAATGTASHALLTRAGLSCAAPILCSATDGSGIGAVLEALGAVGVSARTRPDDGFAWLPVDRAFSLPGHGTVVTGTLRRGRLGLGDALHIVPDGLPVRVRSMQVHGTRVSEAWPGQRVAVNLRQVETAQVPRGTALTNPGTMQGTLWLSVQICAVADAAPTGDGARLVLLSGTGEVAVRLRLLDRDTLGPGETALAQLHCAAPVCVPARERFILRSASPACTIGGGQVLDPEARRERRHAPAVLARLAALASADPPGIIAAELAAAGLAGLTPARLARSAGLAVDRVAPLLPGSAAHLTAGGAVVSADALAALQAVLPRILAAHPAGLPPSGLAALLPRAGAAVLEEAVRRLDAEGVLVRRDATIRLRRPEQDEAAERRRQAVARDLESVILQAGLSPPDLAAIAPDLARRRMIEGLVREGVVVRTTDRVQKRDVFFHRDAIDAARRTLAPLLEGSGLPTGAIGAALGISRKFSVPLLEHLDAVRFTRRVEDRRVLVSGAG